MLGHLCLGKAGLPGNRWEKTPCGCASGISLYLEPWSTPEGIHRLDSAGFWASWFHGENLLLMNPGPNLWASSFSWAYLALTVDTKPGAFFIPFALIPKIVSTKYLVENLWVFPSFCFITEIQKMSTGGKMISFFTVPSREVIPIFRRSRLSSPQIEEKSLGPESQLC